MDNEKIKNAIKEILVAIGENPDREGLIETPDRVARMFNEMFSGISLTNKDIANANRKLFKTKDNDLVVIKNIPCFSYCEHHMALMYDLKISIAYLPNGYVLGLSKFARICDTVCKRLQLQERIGTDIADILEDVLNTRDVAVIITGKHSCMTARGIKKDCDTKTACLRGAFQSNAQLRSEMYSLIKGKD